MVKGSSVKKNINFIIPNIFCIRFQFGQREVVLMYADNDVSQFRHIMTFIKSTSMVKNSYNMTHMYKFVRKQQFYTHGEKKILLYIKYKLSKDQNRGIPELNRGR